MRTLVIADTQGPEAEQVNERLVGAARRVVDGDALLVAVIAPDPVPFAQAVARGPVDEVICVSTAPLTRQDPAVLAAAVTSLIESEGPTLVLCNEGAEARGYLAAVASALKLGFASGVTGVWLDDGELVATRGAYGDTCWLEMDFVEKDRVALVVHSHEFARAEMAPSARAVVRTVELSLPAPSWELLESSPA
ncbi:hypothetical protein GCM10027416_01780 [Okibacterium endophyticum]